MCSATFSLRVPPSTSICSSQLGLKSLWKSLWLRKNDKNFRFEVSFHVVENESTNFDKMRRKKSLEILNKNMCTSRDANQSMRLQLSTKVRKTRSIRSSMACCVLRNIFSLTKILQKIHLWFTEIPIKNVWCKFVVCKLCNFQNNFKFWKQF